MWKWSVEKDISTVTWKNMKVNKSYTLYCEFLKKFLNTERSYLWVFRKLNIYRCYKEICRKSQWNTEENIDYTEQTIIDYSENMKWCRTMRTSAKSFFKTTQLL